MKALVTGGTGFLGRSLLCQLLASGVAVRALARRPADLDALVEERPEWAHLLEVRAQNLAQVDGRSPIGEGCDVVYHLASDLRGSTAGMFLTNVVALRGLIDACARAGVRRFVLVSSFGVYGTGHLRRGAALDERCGLDPEPHRRDPYSYSKVVQEQVAWEAYHAGRLPLVVVRPAVIYGPGRDPLTARVGLRLGGFMLQMGGRHRLPYVYVDNCAKAILLAGTAPAVEGEAFNAIDDELPTGRQIVKLHRRTVGPVRTLTIPTPAIAPLSVFCQWYHVRSNGQLPAVLTPYKSDAQWKPLRYPNAKAKAGLGWRPEVGLDEGLGRTLAWLRQQADGRASSARNINSRS